MRWLAAFFLLLTMGLFGGYIFLKGYPYRLYSNWIEGKEFNKYYQLSKYKKSWLKPIAPDEVPPYKEDYVQLWREFPIRNSMIPLPTRHPLFITIPLLELRNKANPPVIGMIFTGPNKREISRIYTMPISRGQDYTQGQDLFKLPFVRNRIMKLDTEKVWKDIFTYNIEVKSKSMDEMIHDLYILHLRSKVLPPGTKFYGLLKDGKALIELVSKDKDYKIELILNNKNGSIYSYVLKTAVNNEESLKLRSKFIESISFSHIDPDLGKILYTEFKALNFSRQVDQEGLLYLFSAWTQDVEKFELLKEMIFYLERGRFNSSQLKSLYKYSFKKYGKTFTTKNIFTDSDDQNLLLQRKVEIENIERKHEAEKISAVVEPLPELSKEEKQKVHLQKAKEDGPSETEDMTVH